MIADERLAAVLGPRWRMLRFSELDARAYQLEQIARFQRALAMFMVETACDGCGVTVSRRGWHR